MTATSEAEPRFVTFAGPKRVGGGALADAALAAARALKADDGSPVLVFDVETGRVVDLDLRGAEAEIAARYAPPPATAAKRGRPKLGVVAREVTLLPRHWDWLASQPGGASVALRRLVEAAIRLDAEAGAPRARQEAAYRFMAAMGGDLPAFEEATRALFAGDRVALENCMASWPRDIRDQALEIAPPRGEEF